MSTGIEAEKNNISEIETIATTYLYNNPSL